MLQIRQFFCLSNRLYSNSIFVMKKKIVWLKSMHKLFHYSERFFFLTSIRQKLFLIGVHNLALTCSIRFGQSPKKYICRIKIGSTMLSLHVWKMFTLKHANVYPFFWNTRKNFSMRNARKLRNYASKLAFGKVSRWKHSHAIRAKHCTFHFVDMLITWNSSNFLYYSHILTCPYKVEVKKPSESPAETSHLHKCKRNSWKQTLTLFCRMF